METKTINENEIISEANNIWDAWTLMWNGDLPQAEKIIETGFYPNLISDKYVTSKEINNAKKVKGWVSIIRSKFQTLTYETLAGPFTDIKQKTLCCHWKATGIFSGNSDIPTDAAGNKFLIEGTDILKFRNGKIYECWTQSNLVTRND
jgi:hypothetical protein